MKPNVVKLGIDIKSCKECETMSCAIRVMRALQFLHSNGTQGLDGVNFRSALEFDDSRQEIVVNEELLMQAIILANPGQERRKIRLVDAGEFKKVRDNGRSRWGGGMGDEAQPYQGEDTAGLGINNLP